VNFDQAYDFLIGEEGGYSHNSNDPGGETIWGITRRVALQEGYQGDMRYLSRETAKGITQKRYWDAVHADDLPQVMRLPVFDAAFNSGTKQAIQWLQRALDLVDDGVMGPLTLAAAQKADGLKTVVLFESERLDLMTSLPTWAAFSRGWARRVVGNLKNAVAEA
jgi:lysozyme family protein